MKKGGLGSRGPLKTIIFLDFVHFSVKLAQKWHCQTQLSAIFLGPSYGFYRFSFVQANGRQFELFEAPKGLKSTENSLKITENS